MKAYYLFSGMIKPGDCVKTETGVVVYWGEVEGALNRCCEFFTFHNKDLTKLKLAGQIPQNSWPLSICRRLAITEEIYEFSEVKAWVHNRSSYSAAGLALIKERGLSPRTIAPRDCCPYPSGGFRQYKRAECTDNGHTYIAPVRGGWRMVVDPVLYYFGSCRWRLMAVDGEIFKVDIYDRRA